MVRTLLSTKRFEEALQKLDILDSDFPNRRQIINLRKQALKGLGKEMYAEIDGQIIKPEHWERPDQWTEDLIDRTEGRRYRVPWLLEPMAWDPAAYNPDKLNSSDGPDDSSDLKYQIVLIAILLLAGYSLFQALREPAPGTLRTFAEIQFVWVPSVRAEVIDPSTKRSSIKKVAAGFWMSRYELTVEQWNRVQRTTPNRPSGTETTPKTDVSGEEVLAFLEHMNRLRKGHFRLPSPQEWERACSAGNHASAYFFGNDPLELPKYGHFGQFGRSRLEPVGELRPNEWGLQDIYGNAAEMCVDRGAESQETALTPAESASRLVWSAKGGHLESSAEECATAAARPLNYYRGDESLGVRLCRNQGRGLVIQLEGIQFPEERSLGTLYVISSLLGYEIKIPLGRAQGLVPVPRFSRLGLSIGRDGARDLAPIKNIPSDRLIEITSPSGQLQDDQIRHLANFASLEYLDLSNNLITDDGIEWFSGLPKLRVLQLDGTKVTRISLARFHRFPALERLSLASLSGIEPWDLPLLYSLKGLGELNLENSGLKPEDLSELQVRLSRCEIRPTPSPPTGEQALRWASDNRRYSMLLQQELRDDDFGDYGHFAELGYVYEGTQPGYEGFQSGYWVYVSPYWYIWQDAQGELKSPPRPWGPSSATGAPDEEEREIEYRAWRPPRGFPPEAWLMLEYDELLSYTWIRLYSLDGPLWLTRATAFTVKGVEVTIFEGKPIASGPDSDYEGWVTELPLMPPPDEKGNPIKFNRIRLHVDKSISGLKGDETGNVLIDAVALQRPGIQGVFSANKLRVWPKGSACSGFFGQEQYENDTPPQETREVFITDAYTVEYRGYLKLLNLFEGGGQRFFPPLDAAKRE